MDSKEDHPIDSSNFIKKHRVTFLYLFLCWFLWLFVLVITPGKITRIICMHLRMDAMIFAAGASILVLGTVIEICKTPKVELDKSWCILAGAAISTFILITALSFGT